MLYGVLRVAFVTALRDGLAVHERCGRRCRLTWRRLIPELHRHYRQEAWRQLTQEAKTAPVAELWRYTADLIYLIRKRGDPGCLLPL